MNESFPPPPESESLLRREAGQEPAGAPKPSSSSGDPAFGGSGGVSELDVDELKTAVTSLRQLLLLTLAGLVVLLFTVNLLLFHQVGLLRAQVLQMSRQEREMFSFLEDHRTNGAPYFVQFLNVLDQFAARDPHFAQILARYPRFQIPRPPEGVRQPTLPGVGTGAAGEPSGTNAPSPESP
ncbi:MAG: hypothetical protein D6766_07130 [Verrucomicrobia bacterium]|nr:MAG: hypothetical protein D6766_07130 [Verrucomicrobiota bacterium]